MPADKCGFALYEYLRQNHALREQGLNKEANQVIDFIKNLPPVKTDHDLLKEKMLADNVRLQAALAIKTPTVHKVVTQGDDLTPVR